MTQHNFPVDMAINILREAMQAWEQPLIDQMQSENQTPFKILIATILSLRTKDSTTALAAPRLFSLADTPETLLKLSPVEIETAIYPVGFYRTKAKNILKISQMLIDDFGGDVPRTLDALLSLPGVGRKTANLTLTAGFGLPGICVDIHVHRISNRWGYVQTKNADATELALRAKLPQKYWIEYNQLLVTLGQNVCRPTSPMCSRCPISHLCPQIGVTRQR